MQVQRQVTSAIKNFVPVPLLMWPTQRQLKTLLSDTERHVECVKRWKTLWKGASMAGFLLPSLVLLLTATELWWVVAPINTKFIFHPHLGFFRGSAPEPGIWNFGNLTGESNYVGVVKNAFKGSRLDIRCGESVWSSCHPSISPEWSVKQSLLQNHLMCQLGELDFLIKSDQTLNSMKLII